jgi:hypothetical protein
MSHAPDLRQPPRHSYQTTWAHARFGVGHSWTRRLFCRSGADTRPLQPVLSPIDTSLQLRSMSCLVVVGLVVEPNIEVGQVMEPNHSLPALEVLPIQDEVPAQNGTDQDSLVTDSPGDADAFIDRIRKPQRTGCHGVAAKLRPWGSTKSPIQSLKPRAYSEKWWLAPEPQSPDAWAIKAYKDIYRSPLGSARRSAVRALFIMGLSPGHCNVVNGS